jgi:hypothetical protein
VLSHLESEKLSTLHHCPASVFVRDEISAVPEVTALPKMIAVPEIVPEEWQIIVEWEQQRVCEFVESLHNVSNSSYKKIRFVKPTCLNQSYRRLYVLKSGQNPKRIHLSYAYKFP